MAIYEFKIFKISGLTTMSILDSVTVTVDDIDDAFGIGDRDASDRGVTGATESGSIPEITAVSNPAFNSLIGQKISFDGQAQFVGGGFGSTPTGGYDLFAIGFNSHGGLAPDGFRYIAQNINANANIVVGQTYTTNSWRSVLEPEGFPAPICFAFGAMIQTQSGPIAVQDLSIGDMVITKDHGAQPIRWIGSSKRPAVDNMAPILIKKGALGNRHDLRVSPQHRMLVRGKRVQEMCGKGAVLVPAKALVDGQDIIVDLSEPTVDYFHIAFDQHEIIYAEGIPSESLYLGGAEAWKMLHPAQRAELRTIFPDIDPENPSQAYGPTARLSLGKSKAERMLALH